jgi:hypothetical protein
MPTASDLVTDLPADFDVFGQAVDNSLWNSGYGQAGKNKIINGDFSVNQRSFTSTTSVVYIYDRYFTNGADGTVTFSAQTFTLGSAPIAGYEGKNYLRCVTSGQTLTTARANVAQRIESVRTFAGQTVTVSFWAKANTGTPEIGLQFQQSFGTGGSPSTAVNVASKVTISTSWARYSATLNVPSISGKTLGTNNDDCLQLQFWFSGGSSFSSLSGGIGIQNNTFEIWGVQAEYGSKMTPFQLAGGGDPQSELAMCQRYYYRFTPTAAGQRFGVGNCQATTDAELFTQFPVPMRIAPTALEQSGTATDYSTRSGATTTTCSAVPIFSTSTSVNSTFFFTVTTGLVVGQVALGRAANTNAYLGWSAEL